MKTDKQLLADLTRNKKMTVNGLSCILNTPAALERKFDSKDEEIAQQLPPYSEAGAFEVDKYLDAPETWVRGSANESSYGVPVVEGRGIWLDLRAVKSDTHHVAAVVSVQGLNGITGQKQDGTALEQYKTQCPLHKKDFKQDRFCEECKYSWPAQNYLATTLPNTEMWLDGFMTKDGTVRQWILTEDESTGVAAQKIKQDRVHAIGIALYRSKEPKPVVIHSATRGTSSYSSSGGTWKSMSGIGVQSLGGPLYSSNNISSVDNLSCEPMPMTTCSTSEGSDENVMNFSSPAGAFAKTSGSIVSTGSHKEKSKGRSRSKQKKLEIGAGALIDQKITADPNSIDFWNTEPAGVIFINYCSIEQALEILKGAKREEKTEGSLDGLKLAKSF